MWRTILLSCGLIGPAVCSAVSDSELTATLRAKDQALLDAIAPGDRAVWEPMLAPDFVYADENMRVIARADFLKELLPLPKGAGGKIAITIYEMHRMGETAVVVHHDDETEQYFGSELHAQYLMTETWQLLAGEWKLREVHCAAVPVDAATIQLSEEQMDELAGTYRAGSLRYVIRREGDRMMGGRPGGSAVELKAETRDVLITPGEPRTRKVFRRDNQGRVAGFADRRENRDLNWLRLRPGE